MDYALLNLAVTIAALLATLAYRERILAALGRLLFSGAIDFVRATYFDEVSVDTDAGPKRVLRPSAALQSLFQRVAPPLIDWAVKNITLKLPKLELPEGLDLKQAGVMALTQKAMSGKKLKLEDAIPALLGYALDYVQPMLGALRPDARKAGKEAVNPFLKELQL